MGGSIVNLIWNLNGKTLLSNATIIEQQLTLIDAVISIN